MLDKSKLKSSYKKFSRYLRKQIWKLTHNYKFDAKPVFIFGVQRSGTTLFGNCLKESPEIQYYPEHHPKAFHNFKLKDFSLIDKLIKTSPFKLVIFKPLTDSHKAIELINAFGGGKGIWVYRCYQDRANSAVAKFGDHNRILLSDFSKGRNLNTWQAQGLKQKDLKLIKSFNYGKISLKEAASLFWYLRNSLFFSQELEKNHNIFLVCYEDFVLHPIKVMEKVCKYLNCNYSPLMISDIHSRSIGLQDPPSVSEEIHKLCSGLFQRLEAVRQQKEERLIG